MIQRIERFGQPLYLNPLADAERAADARADTEEVVAFPTLRPMKAPLTIGRAGGALNRVAPAVMLNGSAE